MLGGETALPRFYVYEPFDGAAATAGNGAMLAFQAVSEKAVVVAHQAGFAAGGSEEGGRATAALRPGIFWLLPA